MLIAFYTQFFEAKYVFGAIGGGLEASALGAASSRWLRERVEA